MGKNLGIEGGLPVQKKKKKKLYKKKRERGASVVLVDGCKLFTSRSSDAGGTHQLLRRMFPDTKHALLHGSVWNIPTEPIFFFYFFFNFIYIYIFFKF